MCTVITYEGKNITADNRTQGAQNNNTDDVGYVRCFYENIPFYKSSKKTLLKNRIIIALCVYSFVELVFFLLCHILPKDIFVPVKYNWAALSVGTILFWPLIIIHSSELFYSVYQKLKPLLNDVDCKDDSWYESNARKAFQLINQLNAKSIFFAILNIFCSIFILTTYFLLLKGDKNMIDLLEIGMPIAIGVSGFCYIFSSENQNLQMILVVICCGLSYFIYLQHFSNSPNPALINEQHIMLVIITTIIVMITFFIAGSSIYPMYHIFKLFFLSGFEEKLSYPIKNILKSSEALHSIKEYFTHLAIVCLVAYFQLLVSIYLMGIIKKEAVLTIVLFILGSFIPLIMFLAISVFFKILSHKIYIMQLNNMEIDDKIDNIISNDTIDNNELKSLIATKELYANELETKVIVNREIFAALLSPVVTAILTIVFGVK